MRHGESVQALTHEHVFLHKNHRENERRTLWVVALTAMMMVAEIAAGQMLGSMALLADGFHMATHAGALGITAAAYAFARKRARDSRFSFGTGKVGDLAGFASALILGMVAIGVAVESAMRLVRPEAIAYREAILIASLGLAVNILSAWMLSGGGTSHADDHDDHDHHHDHGHHHHHHHHDNNFRSAYIHVIADAVTSVGAIVALCAGLWLGWNWLDPLIGIAGALLIGQWSVSLLRDTGAVLLDAAEPALSDTIRRRIEADEDAHVTDVHVWRVGPGAFSAIISLVADRPLEPAAYKARLDTLDSLAHVTIEVHSCPGGH